MRMPATGDRDVAPDRNCRHHPRAAPAGSEKSVKGKGPPQLNSRERQAGSAGRGKL
jgi:hypothetical protein